jgi:hypothetical protein
MVGTISNLVFEVKVVHKSKGNVNEKNHSDKLQDLVCH